MSELKEYNYKKNYMQFNPEEYGRIYVFVDFANVRNWSKVFWPKENSKIITRDIDIEKLGSLIDSIKPKKKLFYYGFFMEHPNLSPKHQLNKKHRGSIYRISKAQKAKFKTESKEVKEINEYDEEGKFVGKKMKCNFDVEIAMDMLLKKEKYDTILLWSGDSDFHKLLKHLKVSDNKKSIVVCCRDFMSKELDDASDLYVPADAFKDILEYINEAPPAEAGGHKNEPNIP